MDFTSESVCNKYHSLFNLYLLKYILLVNFGIKPLLILQVNVINIPSGMQISLGQYTLL